MKRPLTLSLAATFLLSAAPLATAQEVATVLEQTGDVTIQPIEQSGVVELAICLDTSGSMDGLINAARQKLWSIVNELATAKPTPKLRVALLTYGNDGHAEENGWVRVNAELTEDLDKISEMLFALTTNGGTELVGRVLQSSIEELDWTPSVDALKMIWVAGNESADQDQEVPFRDMCKRAIEMGVMVNSIYCVYHGDDPTIASGWEQVARLADGQYATIDQNNTAVVIATPLDDRLIELSSALNETYIPIGTEGEAGWANQREQDFNALVMNKAAAASRAQTKGGALYFCSWDLCDASAQEDFDWESVEVDDLPEFMQNMTLEERKQYVEDKRAEREAIQKKINDLNAQRQQYVIAEQKRQADRGVDQFDLIINAAVREQARAKGFEIKPPEETAAANAAKLPYFVQYGDAWVAASFADAFQSMHRHPSAGAVELEEGTEAYEAFAARLDKDTRAALESIDGGRAFIKVDQTVYQINTKAPEGDAPEHAAADRQQTLQVAQRAAGQRAGRQVVAQTAQQVNPQQIRSAPRPPVRPAPQQQQQQEEQIIPVQTAFVQRGHFWVDESYAAEYDALAAQSREPKFDETVENTPEGRKALLDRMTTEQRKQAEEIFGRMLDDWTGGLIVRIDGKLVFLPFEC